MKILNRYTGAVLFDSGRANLIGANLSGADLIGADLSYANLSGANLSGADLSYANLSRANLSRAKLSGANLSGADLSYANLSRANLSRADLSYAKLSYANLIVGGQRSDGWRFLAFKVDDVVMVSAGCRYFTIEQAREHWLATRGGTQLGAESIALLDGLVLQARAVEWIK